MMRHRLIYRISMLMLVSLLFSGLLGCDSSTTLKGIDDGGSGDPSPVPGEALTGDISLFPNSELLASDEDILLDGNVTAAENGIVLVDTRSAEAYAAGHIPGAINAEWGDFALWNDPPEKAVLKPVAALEEQLGALGLTRTSNIIIYDDTLTSWGSAGRVFWMLESLGCVNVQILNGGWDKWAADGLPVETTESTLPSAEFIADVTLFPHTDASKEYILSRLGEDDFVLVDTRKDEEYTGWTLYDEVRGGHIPGAVQLPYETYYNSDSSILSYDDLKALLDSNGITSDREVVAYCTAGIRSGFFYFLGRLMGYSQVSNYDGSIWDWAAADASSYPMDSLENYQTMVYPGWVDALIQYHSPDSGTDAPPDYTYGRDHRYLIFETQWGSFDDMEQGWADDSYLRGHIPGAIHSNSDVYENNYPRWFKLPDDELRAAVGSMGITADTTVVVYSDSPIFAARLWWILRYAGVTDVRILNGGYEAWVAAGYEEETDINEPVAVTYEGDVNLAMVAETPYVETVYNTGNTILADVRTYPEYAGETSGYSYVVNRGRIPGAIYAFNADQPDLDYLDSDGTLRSYDLVRDMWENVGIPSAPDSAMFEKEVIFYCGSGYRSSLAYLYAYLMGYDNARNYSDGWEGWSTNYIEDPSYTAPEDLPGATDGWIQDPSGRPAAYGVHPEWDFDVYSNVNVNRIVDARWIKTMLMDNDNYGNPYVIVGTGWGPEDDPYLSGHVPGAIWVNTDEIEYDCFNPRNDWPVDAGDPACWDRSTTEEQDLAKGLDPDDSLPRNWWNIYPDEYLIPAIAYMGIDKNTTVVVYSDDPTAAARVVWTLMYAGVEDVRFLDGGKFAWEDAGYVLETGTNPRTPVDYFDPDDQARSTAIHPEYKVDIPYVRDVVNGVETDGLIMDIRTHEEYIGASAPYSYIPTSGRIPGAVWGKAGTGPWSMEDYVNADGTLKSPQELYSYWISQGINFEKHLSFYCGTAWRSSLGWFYGYVIGYPNISNFDGSWFEWSMGEGSAYNGDDPVLNPIVDDSPDLP